MYHVWNVYYKSSVFFYKFVVKFLSYIQEPSRVQALVLWVSSQWALKHIWLVKYVPFTLELELRAFWEFETRSEEIFHPTLKLLRVWSISGSYWLEQVPSETSRRCYLSKKHSWQVKRNAWNPIGLWSTNESSSSWQFLGYLVEVVYKIDREILIAVPFGIIKVLSTQCKASKKFKLSC